MNTGGDHEARSLAAELADGRLPEEAAEALRARALTDSALADELRLQDEVTASIRRSFALPAQMPVTLPPSRANASPLRLRRLAFLAVAALVLIAAYLGWATLNPPMVDATRVYAAIARGGFAPMTICTTEPAFRQFMTDTFGQDITFNAETGINMAGWSYNLGIHGPGTAALLAKVDGKDVVVFIERSANVHGGLQVEQPGLKVLRRQIGNLVFDEVTPLDRPVVADSLRLATTQP